ncbi:hypothetical protein M422DRAFT_40819 [Sphaerobolus stellatus SS14]|nr:hypothetical protein M422DRAFT_40819 [Sphaerobolus stellatus SS14]
MREHGLCGKAMEIALALGKRGTSSVIVLKSKVYMAEIIGNLLDVPERSVSELRDVKDMLRVAWQFLSAVTTLFSIVVASGRIIGEIRTEGLVFIKDVAGIYHANLLLRLEEYGARGRLKDPYWQFIESAKTHADRGDGTIQEEDSEATNSHLADFTEDRAGNLVEDMMELQNELKRLIARIKRRKERESQTLGETRLRTEPGDRTSGISHSIPPWELRLVQGKPFRQLATYLSS